MLAEQGMSVRAPVTVRAPVLGTPGQLCAMASLHGLAVQAGSTQGAPCGLQRWIPRTPWAPAPSWEEQRDPDCWGLPRAGAVPVVWAA